MNDGNIRCPWATREPELTYHDNEWGVPERDDARLFEMLSLEGAQAGLSWTTILRKREGYRRVFAGFDPALVAGFDAAAVDAACTDPGIVRHRGKIRSTVANAAAVLAVSAEFGSFAAYIWSFAPQGPIRSRYALDADVPARTPLSDAVSRDLRKRGFTFVGSTIVLAFLQATGVVDDHRAECFCAAGG